MRLLKIFSSLLIFTIKLFSQEKSSTNSNLIYQSNFEKSILLTPQRNDSPIWWQRIKREDNTTKEIGCFQIIINSKKLNHYVENRIEETIGIDNKKSKALHQIIKKKEHEWTQVPYLIETNDKEVKQLYIRYSIKYPKNLSKLIGKEGWVVLSEFKTVSDYRLAIYIYKDKNGKLYWYAHGDNVVLDDVPYVEYWERENRDVPVPVGEWIDVEIFWKRGKGKDGRVWLCINGKTAIDYHGKTKIKDPIRIIMPYTNYSSRAIDQWIDNVEIWDNFPCGESKSCHKKYNNLSSTEYHIHNFTRFFSKRVQSTA